jgi:4-amino-4-deoxy-L-arabinose transferase-like glycosyltransferase
MDRSRPDYPVLMPSTVAGLWTLIGDDTVLIPALLAILFAFATVGLTVSSLAILRGRSEACLAGLILLGTPLFITHSASQYADVPLAFFVLATLVLVALCDDAGGQAGGIMVLAGVTAGLAGWTKNEGLLFVVAVMVARAVVIIPADGLRAWAREIGRFAAGLAPIAVILIHFKSTLAPPNYLVALQESRDIYVKLFDFSRYRVVWAAIGEQVWTFGGWAVSLPMILAFYVLLVGIQANRRATLSIVTSAITLSLMLLGESLIYVITPIDLKFQVDLSLGRLLLQLWPVFIFTYFLLVQPVGPIVGPERRPGAAGREAVDAVGGGR